MKKINTSTLLLSLLAVLLVCGAIWGGIYFARSKNLVLVSKTNTVSNTTVDTPVENQTAKVDDSLNNKVDIDQEISELDKSIKSIESDEFNENDLKDSELGI